MLATWETQPLSGRSGSWVIQYSVAGVGGVVNRALTTQSRPAATVAVVRTSRPGSDISPSTTPAGQASSEPDHRHHAAADHVERVLPHLQTIRAGQHLAAEVDRVSAPSVRVDAEEVPRVGIPRACNIFARKGAAGIAPVCQHAPGDPD